MVELFGREWEDVEVVIETAAAKRGESRAQVIVDLIARSEARPGVQSRFRRTLIRWIGKPWRERANPWDRFKDRIPPAPPSVAEEPSDLDEWPAVRHDEE